LFGCSISVLVLGERWSLSWNAMINGYGWIGNLDESQEFFDQRPFKNVLSWDSLLALCDRCEDVEGRIPIFNEKEAGRGKKKKSL